MRQLFLSAAVIAMFAPNTWAEEKKNDKKQWEHPDVVKGKFFLGFVGEMEKNLKLQGEERLKTEYEKLKLHNLGLEVGYHSDVKYSFWFSGCLRLKWQDEKKFKYKFSYNEETNEEKESEVTLHKATLIEPNISVGYSFRPGMFAIIPHVGVGAQFGIQTVKDSEAKGKTKIYVTPEAFIGIRFSASFFYVSPYYKISASKSVENAVKVFDKLVDNGATEEVRDKTKNHMLDILTHSIGVSIGAEL